ncbi:MAG: hypothetical protein KZQ66_18720 [Candidatus Thiodiazotropha sp. (ex Lucinoma aequizonata)]|nr:hypothetical protein [Candidatus Thiodiazotropha sp. (ex Lucinoma aequizonata)]MCU7894955.1 hypothetical protein [Candidatus Thiodiazotropha sp. (ex Lucinoma aequizonata)]MCU7898119.1 hypothetical protein [Candidatus Thiodiazotropha sp. (ex Lucinoma aequizonata)]MCU7903760.1 hypothetical protein [Candidatus Thiodiazotropha sp. (ex Lucinoma aequizonata)]MCU7912348.1 hypothetical protein [Candidatus Thiodiazotropha sp. (ex Lucinoma aequizonata)]
MFESYRSDIKHVKDQGGEYKKLHNDHQLALFQQASAKYPVSLLRGSLLNASVYSIS